MNRNRAELLRLRASVTHEISELQSVARELDLELCLTTKPEHPDQSLRQYVNEHYRTVNCRILSSSATPNGWVCKVEQHSTVWDELSNASRWRIRFVPEDCLHDVGLSDKDLIPSKFRKRPIPERRTRSKGESAPVDVSALNALLSQAAEGATHE